MSPPKLQKPPETDPPADGYPEAEVCGLWHAWPVDQVLEELQTDRRRGLANGECERRLEQYGPNKLQETQVVHWYIVLGRQFVDVLVIILMIAAAISVAIGEVIDAVAIMAIVVLNGALGFVQEWRAERAIQALQRMLSPRCRVVRGGGECEIDAEGLVPGDMLILSVGDHVPGDVRLVESANLKLNEAVLTGESAPVAKNADPVDADAELSDRSSMAWMGTTVANGRAKAVVVATGMNSQFGRIAELTAGIARERTPLQHKLAHLGKQLGLISIGVAVVICTVGLLMGKGLLEMFMTGVALAVAVVPEGLPAVVTITLAFGIRAMVRRRALVRRLQSAETLGSASVIITDKTGTLTKNEMTVTHVWLPAGEMSVTGVGYEPKGDFNAGPMRIEANNRPDLKALLYAGMVCNHAQVTMDDHQWAALGDPTEAALLVAARKAGMERDEERYSDTEFSFDSARKRMTLIERRSDSTVAYMKGAPEVILQRCSRILDGREERELTNEDHKRVIDAYQEMARHGLRTLALSHRTLPADGPLDEDEVESNQTLLGVVGIIDPARAEVPNAIKLARGAGIEVIVATGDAGGTALAVARDIGLPVERVVTGRELEAMDDHELRDCLARPDVLFARAAPEDKMRLVDILEAEGHVVGMTGDGVNDAPALKRAAIGIAMGQRGTDVAKAASDLILTDDNFATIIGAVEEGRRQYDNIQKFVRYLISSNTAEVVAILINIILGGPLILLPVQILWMNLITDGLTAVALGVEPTEKDVMQRAPRGVNKPVLDRLGFAMILTLGTYMGLATLWLFHHYLAIGAGEHAARTVAFTGLILAEKMNVFNFRSLRSPLASIGFFSNPWVLVAWVFNLGLQLLAVYTPFMQKMLHTTALGWTDWGLMVLFAVPVFLIPEAFKWIRWRRSKR